MKRALLVSVSMLALTVVAHADGYDDIIKGVDAALTQYKSGSVPYLSESQYTKADVQAVRDAVSTIHDTTKVTAAQGDLNSSQKKLSEANAAYSDLAQRATNAQTALDNLKALDVPLTQAIAAQKKAETAGNAAFKAMNDAVQKYGVNSSQAKAATAAYSSANQAMGKAQGFANQVAQQASVGLAEKQREYASAKTAADTALAALSANSKQKQDAQAGITKANSDLSVATAKIEAAKTTAKSLTTKLVNDYSADMSAAQKDQVGAAALQASAAAKKQIAATTAGGAPSVSNVAASLVPPPTVGGGNLIATGGGNLVAVGGGNLVAVGGGNLVAVGGGNLVAVGGGNLVAVGGGNLVGNASGTAIAPNASNVVSNDNAGILSSAGGGIVSKASGGVIGENSSGLVALSLTASSLTSKSYSLTSVDSGLLTSDQRIAKAANGLSAEDKKELAAIGAVIKSGKRLTPAQLTQASQLQEKVNAKLDTKDQAYLTSKAAIVTSAATLKQAVQTTAVNESIQAAVAKNPAAANDPKALSKAVSTELAKQNLPAADKKVLTTSVTTQMAALPKSAFTSASADKQRASPSGFSSFGKTQVVTPTTNSTAIASTQAVATAPTAAPVTAASANAVGGGGGFRQSSVTTTSGGGMDYITGKPVATPSPVAPVATTTTASPNLPNASPVGGGGGFIQPSVTTTSGGGANYITGQPVPTTGPATPATAPIVAAPVPVVTAETAGAMLSTSQSVLQKMSESQIQTLAALTPQLDKMGAQNVANMLADPQKIAALPISAEQKQQLQSMTPDQVAAVMQTTKVAASLPPAQIALYLTDVKGGADPMSAVAKAMSPVSAAGSQAVSSSTPATTVAVATATGANPAGGGSPLVSGVPAATLAPTTTVQATTPASEALATSKAALQKLSSKEVRDIAVLTPKLDKMDTGRAAAIVGAAKSRSALKEALRNSGLSKADQAQVLKAAATLAKLTPEQATAVVQASKGEGKSSTTQIQKRLTEIKVAKTPVSSTAVASRGVEATTTRTPVNQPDDLRNSPRGAPITRKTTPLAPVVTRQPKATPIVASRQSPTATLSRPLTTPKQANPTPSRAMVYVPKSAAVTVKQTPAVRAAPAPVQKVIAASAPKAPAPRVPVCAVPPGGKVPVCR